MLNGIAGNGRQLNSQDASGRVSRQIGRRQQPELKKGT